MGEAPCLVVEGLRVDLAKSTVDVVDDISLTVDAGQVVGLVGESGSGKTTVALALLGHARRGLKVVAGTVILEGRDVLTMSPHELKRLRGRGVAYVPQDPGSALNPSLKVGYQLKEALEVHAGEDSGLPDVKERMAQVLAEVDLTASAEILGSYPHQLSGGQQQRIALAMAFSCRPGLIVLDEPTTGLDVATQRHVLDTVRGLCRSYGVAAVYVTHDLAVIAEIADRVAVMYAGWLIELGSTKAVFESPAHPYTAGLLKAIPSPEISHSLIGMEGQPPQPGKRPPGCLFEPRCPHAIPECSRARPRLEAVNGNAHEARCIRAKELILTAAGVEQLAAERADVETGATKPPLFVVKGLDGHYAEKQILYDVSLEIPETACVAVVGESGSGKTTLARCLTGMHGNWTGSVSFAGKELKPTARERDLEVLRSVQYIFQNPYTSLNPRKTIGQLVEQPLAHFFKLSPRERTERVVDDARGRGAERRLPGPLPGPAQRRRASAGGHRAGAHRGAEIAGVRRGHLGARRVRAGGGRGTSPPPAARTRPEPALHHAQPRPRAQHRAGGRRLARRPHRRARADGPGALASRRRLHHSPP